MSAGAPLQERLDPLRRRTDAAIERLLPPADQVPERLHEAMRYAMTGTGKRLRPALVFAAAESIGSPDPGPCDVPAVAVECIHAYSLVHDDLPAMDDDDWRRGQPTCHRAFDEATAILVGDALQSLAFELLATAPSDAEGCRRMLACLARASGSHGMAGGQALDLGAVGQTLDRAALEQMHGRKTAALIAASVELGALAAGERDDDRLEALRRYGHAVGLAFQIHDDVLDVAGDTATLGKTQGADAARGKPTYPSALGLEEARRLAQMRADEAIEALSALPGETDLLRAIARYCVERDH